MHGSDNKREADQKDRQHEIVHRQGVAEIDDTEKLAARHSLDAVLAAGEARLQGDEIDHLRQRQGDHREIDALAADRQPAEDRTKEGRSGGPGEKAEFGRETPYFDGVSRDVSGAAEEGRMAERQQPDIADQQVEGAGEQRKAQRLHNEDRVQDERRDQCQGDQDRR